MSAAFLYTGTGIAVCMAGLIAKQRRSIMAKGTNPQKELWANALKAKGGRPQKALGTQPGKGLGPNKACGHKGGISRQGSKRG